LANPKFPENPRGNNGTSLAAPYNTRSIFCVIASGGLPRRIGLAFAGLIVAITLGGTSRKSVANRVNAGAVISGANLINPCNRVRASNSGLIGFNRRSSSNILRIEIVVKS
jgi:hypothetical protein